MRYLSGAVYAPILHWKHGGIMLTPEMGNHPDLEGVYWAADNGCYTAGARFRVEKWVKFLEKFAGQGQCLFAVAPDVPFDAKATWERSRPFLPMLRDMGYKAALAIQNGIDVHSLDWDAFDAVFIAGTKAFKTGGDAYTVIREAKRRGHFVHIARRNSARGIQEAFDMGADSCDGTFLRYAPDFNWPRMQVWFDTLCSHVGIEQWGDDIRFGRCLSCHRQVRCG
jgi:hypothetical protein